MAISLALAMGALVRNRSPGALACHRPSHGDSLSTWVAGSCLLAVWLPIRKHRRACLGKAAEGLLGKGRSGPGKKGKEIGQKKPESLLPGPAADASELDWSPSGKIRGLPCTGWPGRV